MTIKKEHRDKLTEAAKGIYRFYYLLSDESKNRGMNKGRGYSYRYIRDVIIYGTNDNIEIMELAIELIEKIKKEKQDRIFELEAKIEAL